jgi:hypothetical protein
MILDDGTVIIPTHFSVVTDRERVACVPELRYLHTHENKPAWQRSADPRVVSCPMCMATKEYNDAITTAAELPRPRYKMVLA